MKLEFDTNIADFLKNTSRFLESEPATNFFLLSLAAYQEQSDSPVHRMIRVLDNEGRVLAAALQTTPERGLILSKMPPDHAKQFAETLALGVDNLPSASGPRPAVDEFAKAWTRVVGGGNKIAMNMRLFELTSVLPPRAPAGLFRPAQPRDENTIVEWLMAFRAEAVPHDPKPKAEILHQETREAIGREHYYVWEDAGRIVSLVGARRETAYARWVAPVYTPPQWRGRGYAAALVAEASQTFVDSGKRGMLFTDLANPTSNGIYQKVGYCPISDFRHILFTA